MRSFLAAAGEGYRDPCWAPSVDVYRGATGWLAKFDLAGVCKDDVQLAVQGRRLTVRGSRRDATLIEGQVAYSMEISYNRFERSIEMPFNVEQATVDVEYRDGMLLVHITPGPTKP
jgi:HSP20 family protein